VKKSSPSPLKNPVGKNEHEGEAYSMEFLKKLFGLPGPPEQAPCSTVFVVGLSDSDALPRAEVVHVPLLQGTGIVPASIDDEYLEARFIHFLGQDPPFAALHFEPEEECCFVYYYRDNEILKVHSLTSGDWDRRVEKLKSLDYKEIPLPSGLFIVSLIVSFSNFGERISVILEPIAGDAEHRLKSSKKSCIRLLNSLKPATSLTELNRVHLARFIEMQISRCGPGLVESLAAEGLVTPALLDECSRLSRERSIPVDSLLIGRGVFPRKLLTRLVADWAGFCYVDIDEVERDPRVARLFGQDFCQSRHILPFKMDDAEIIVAFAYPGDEETMKKIELQSARKVVVTMSAAEDIRNRVVELFRRPAEED
jgi:hypothetical protein